MTGLTSQVAIEEFLKQGMTHNRHAWRRSWPTGDMLIKYQGTVARLDEEGNVYELNQEDLDATDWMLDENEFL